MQIVKTTIKCNSISEFNAIHQYISQSGCSITFKGKRCGFLDKIEEWHVNTFHPNVIELTVSGAVTKDIVKMMEPNKQKVSFEITNCKKELP